MGDKELTLQDVQASCTVGGAREWGTEGDGGEEEARGLGVG